MLFWIVVSPVAVPLLAVAACATLAASVVYFPWKYGRVMTRRFAPPESD